jgi:flagellar biosynthesis anti-sigma factor FlgM
MEIKKISAYVGRQVGKPQEAETGRVDQGKTGAGKETTASGGSDRVELSKEYQTISRAMKVTMDLDDIRSEQVDHLRTMIKNNTYKVDAEKVADRMLEELQ